MIEPKKAFPYKPPSDDLKKSIFLYFLQAFFNQTKIFKINF